MVTFENRKSNEKSLLNDEKLKIVYAIFHLFTLVHTRLPGIWHILYAYTMGL